MEHIGKALDGFIKNSKIEKGLDQNKALLIWADVVGEKLRKTLTPSLSIRELLLFVQKHPHGGRSYSFKNLKL